VKIEMKTNFTKLTIIGILVSILTLGLTASLISAKAITRNINIDRSYVAPQPDKTLRFDAGFAAAYLGLPLKGHHTQEYIIGYMNGTASYEK
jgi:hypothetical protein